MTTKSKNNRSLHNSYPNEVTEGDAAIFVAELEPKFFHLLSKRTQTKWEMLSPIEKYKSLLYQQKRQNKLLASRAKKTKCSIEHHLLKPTSDIVLDGLDNKDLIALYSKLNGLANKVFEEITKLRKNINLFNELSERRKHLRMENIIISYLHSTEKAEREYDEKELIPIYEKYAEMSKRDLRKIFSSNAREISALSRIIKSNNKNTF